MMHAPHPSSTQPHFGAGDPLLAVACPSCHGALAVTTALAGGAAQCPLCAGGFLVPVPLSPVAAPLEQPPQPRSELEFAEPVPATIAGAEGVIELRRLKPEEKAARRSRRNAIMLLTGVSILMTIVLLLGTKKK